MNLQTPISPKSPSSGGSASVSPSYYQTEVITETINVNPNYQTEVITETVTMNVEALPSAGGYLGVRYIISHLIFFFFKFSFLFSILQIAVLW